MSANGSAGAPDDDYLFPETPEEERGAVAALPGLARIAATAWWHTAGWAARTSVRASLRLAEAAVSPRAASGLAQDLRRTVRDAVRELIEVTDLEDYLDGTGPAAEMAKRVVDVVGSPADIGDSNHRADGSRPSLREEGEELMRRSRDVHYEEPAHPAYARILCELAPDEARILRLLLLEGPQPAIDVRTGGPVGVVRSRLIAPGLTMIGPRAGCRYPDRVPSYLNNLFRLGMVWFSRETLSDPLRYQVLEAQPDVIEAMHSVRYAKVVRRSIHLTPFGDDFCRVALMSDATSLDNLPAHSTPPQAEKAVRPPAAVSD